MPSKPSPAPEVQTQLTGLHSASRRVGTLSACGSPIGGSNKVVAV